MPESVARITQCRTLVDRAVRVVSREGEIHATLPGVYPSPFNVIPPLLPKELKEVAEEGGSLAESVLILLRLFDGGPILGSDSVFNSTPENGKGSDCKL